jgi:hypothetical protein
MSVNHSTTTFGDCGRIMVKRNMVACSGDVKFQ